MSAAPSTADIQAPLQRSVIVLSSSSLMQIRARHGQPQVQPRGIPRHGVRAAPRRPSHSVALSQEYWIPLLQANSKFDSQTAVMEGSPEVRHRRADGGAGQRSGGGQRPSVRRYGLATGDHGMSARLKLRNLGRCRETGTASSEKLRRLVALLSNKPLQRTIPPQGHWCNINEPLVRRARR